MVRESHVDRMGSMQDVAYEILNVLEFNRSALFGLKFDRLNHYSALHTLLPFSFDLTLCCTYSTRKRQSVVCRFPNGKLVLYCKVI